MLEFTYYNTEKIDDLKDFFTVAFVLIDDIYNEIIPESIKNRRNIYECRLFDSGISTYGYCASQKETYFGLKLHALVTINGFVTNFIVTSANADDREVVFELVETNNTLKILGDKGYIDNKLKAALAKENEVLLISLKRKNSKHQLEKQLRNALSKARRSCFSQLAEQFNIKRVLAKSRWGLMLRIVLKVLSNNLSFILNIIIGNTINIAQIKQIIF